MPYTSAPPPSSARRARLPWLADAPAATVVLVVSVLALAIGPLAQTLQEGVGAQHGP